MPSYKSPVVDACIAGAANESGKNKEAIHAWNCLVTIREKGIVIILSEELKIEWLNHGSKSSKMWLSSMIAKGKTKSYKDNGLYNRFYKKIDNGVPKSSTRIKLDMKKDVHLFCAAIANDRTIISYNDKEAKIIKNI
ncbi:MAG: hypothetical protein ACXW4B_00415 [Micavibrio sp.]